MYLTDKQACPCIWHFRVFYRCCRSAAAETPVKYECDEFKENNLKGTSNFAAALQDRKFCLQRNQWTELQYPPKRRWNLNSLRPSDAIWWHRSGSSLAQIMACCLTAPSHYLNQCWLIINKVQWHSSEGNFVRDTVYDFKIFPRTAIWAISIWRSKARLNFVVAIYFNDIEKIKKLQ